MDLNLFCLGCSAVTMPNLTVSIRDADRRLPTGAGPGDGDDPRLLPSGAAGVLHRHLRLAGHGDGGHAVRDRLAVRVGAHSRTRDGLRARHRQHRSNPLRGRARRGSSANSGVTWAVASPVAANNDHGVQGLSSDQGFPLSGTFVSSLKDANPATGAVAALEHAVVDREHPAGTTSSSRPPPATTRAAPSPSSGRTARPRTFFTSGGSLAQFNGKRYLKYQASLTTSSAAVTPALNDVTVCFQDVPTTTTAITSDTPDPSVVGAPVAVTYTVTANAPSPNTITGNVIVTDGVDMCTGTVAAGGCTLTLHTVGPRTLTATYQGDANFLASPASVGEPHTVNKADTTAAITARPAGSVRHRRTRPGQLHA